jgi:acetoin utilization protein AcuB
LLQQVGQFERLMKVADWMTTKVETVHPRDTLADAEEKMRRGRFRRLPVIDDGGAVIGILTDRDLQKHVGYLQTTRVTAAMVDDPLTVGSGEPIERAAEIMLDRKIGGLPVMNKGALVGIITATDLLAGFLQRAKYVDGDASDK